MLFEGDIVVIKLRDAIKLFICHAMNDF